MKFLALLLLVDLLPTAVAASNPAAETVTVKILAFSDYHSHAVPFYSEGQHAQGGIARAVALLREHRTQPRTLVLSGGDMLNAGSPTWSDEYRCVEWPWLDGLLDAMALGNHDLDYGPEVFEACHRGRRFPVLAANLLRTDGQAYFQVDGKPYLIKELGGVRLGLFAVVGDDVAKLVRPEHLPPGTHWAKALPTAKRMVSLLREEEGVQAVIFLGHQRREKDAHMAREVPGIDLILGSHSHHKSGLVRLPDTGTYTIAPFQYLAYVSEVALTFRANRLESVRGRLIPMDATRPQAKDVAMEVASLQHRLKQKHPELFAPVGRALSEMSVAGATRGESMLGNWATDVLRQSAGTHVFFSTASSFRAGLPQGDVSREDFLAAFPYANEIVVAEVMGTQLREWVELSLSLSGADRFSQFSGLRLGANGSEGITISVLADPRRPDAGFRGLDPARSYRLGTTDYQGFVADGYKELFASARSGRRTGIDVSTTLLDALTSGPITGRLDGRDGQRPKTE